MLEVGRYFDMGVFFAAREGGVNPMQHDTHTPFLQKSPTRTAITLENSLLLAPV